MWGRRRKSSQELGVLQVRSEKENTELELELNPSSILRKFYSECVEAKEEALS